MNNNIHFFDIKIAEQVGIVPAILYQNIGYWVDKNTVNGTNFYDGYYWTYNSVKAFAKLFPYMTAKQIRTGLEKLEKLGFVKTGNYNKEVFDRTKWYTIDKNKEKDDDTVCPVGQRPLPCGAETIALEGRPIPDINIPDINTDIKDIVELDSTTYPFREVIEYLNEKTNSNYRPSVEKNKKLIRARINEGFTLDDFKTVIDKKTKEWKDDKAMCIYLRPETLFGTKFEGYLNQKGAYDEESTINDEEYGLVL